MTEATFVQRNNQLWKSLEAHLEAPANSFKLIEARMNLYRVVSGHLSYARAHYPGSSLCEYLERLTAQAHGAIYTHTQKGREHGSLLRSLPSVFMRNIHFIWISAALFLIAAVVGYTVSYLHPEYVNAFLPASYQDISPEHLNMSEQDLINNTTSSPIMSNQIMVNNIYVSILAFGLGISFGIGTVYVLLHNGFMLGALASVYALYGNSLFFWSIILPHGVWELTAIFIAGGAGLCLGYSLIRPGPYRRVDALLTSARGALGLMGLVTFLLCVAAVVEGFFTPSAASPTVKLTFAACTALPLLAFYLWAKKRATSAAL